MKESTVFFGPERILIGTHTFGDEAAGATADLGVILGNAGLLARTGPHGINLTLARALSRISVPSLRFDKSGVGDSRRPSNPLPFEQQSILDTRLAIDEAQARHGVRRFVMIGFCSGADDAHLTALQDERLCGLLLWDPYIYPTLKSRVLYLQDRVRELGLPGAMGRGLRLAARALYAQLQRGRALALGRQAPAPLARYWRSYIPPATQYAARLRQLLDRGVDIKIIYSGGFPGDYNYANQYRDSFRGCGIADRISCMYLPNADHTLTSRASQQALVKIAVEWVDSLRARGLPTAAPVAGP
jgi:hypothetical protein